MQRFILFSILLCGLNISLFSIELSAGGGAVILPYLEGLNVTAPGYQTGNIRNHWADWGVYAFFDAQYIETEIGYYRAFFGNYEQSNFGYPLDLKSEYDDINISYIDLGIILKYPVKYTKYTVTPLFGFSYWINIHTDYGYKNAYNAANDIKKKDWDQMWIKFGLSVDRYFTKKIYARFTTKLNFPLKTKDWKNRGNRIDEMFGTGISGVSSKYFGVGGEFSLSVGYKIK